VDLEHGESSNTGSGDKELAANGDNSSTA